LILNIDSQTSLSGFFVVFNTTIKNEVDGIRGISHFIEHLICKNFNDMLYNFERDGITWNAYTTDNRIVFYINGLERYLPKYKTEFLERIINYPISEENVERERKVIIEEYLDSFNKQRSSHFLNLYRKLFNNYNPIGGYNDIMNITYEQIIRYRNTFYSYPSKIINVSKSNKFNSDIKFNDYINDHSFKYLNGNEYIYQQTNEFNLKSSIIYLSEIISDNYPIIKFTSTLIGNGLKSPLYRELRENMGLIYYINCNLDHLSNTSSIINISTETTSQNIDLLNDKMYSILKQKENIITKERFENIKRLYKINHEKMDINRYKNVNKYINPQEWIIESHLDTFTLDDVYDTFDQYFNYDKLYFSVDSREFNEKKQE